MISLANNNISNKSADIQSVICVEILKKTLYKNIRYFDLVLLLPSLVFLVFLLVQSRNMIKSIAHNSSIINTLYILLCLACSLKVIRSLVAMVLNPDDKYIQIADKILWLIVRFFLLASEMSIVTFGVASARLDSRTGIRRVLILTSLISFSYTSIQATLEFVLPDKRFQSLYGHGGALFFFVSSLFFFIVYCFILILPSIGCDRRLKLPTKKIFYVYCGILALLYLIESIGSIMFYLEIIFGLCLIDVTTLIYFTGYDPLVYATFLHNYFRNRNALASKYDRHLEYPDNYSNFTNSASHNNMNQSIKALDNEFDPDVEISTHFDPDILVTLNRDDVDPINISQIMKNYNIISEGAQMEYATRYPSIITNNDNPSSEEREKSIIVSLNEEVESVRRETWDLTDFANS